MFMDSSKQMNLLNLSVLSSSCSFLTPHALTTSKRKDNHNSNSSIHSSTTISTSASNGMKSATKAMVMMNKQIVAMIKHGLATPTSRRSPIQVARKE